MNASILRSALTVFIVALSISTYAQAGKQKKQAPYPATFTITKAEFDKLFLYKPQSIIKNTNRYLEKSVLLMSTQNGDMKFLKLKLNYFKNAFLLVQVNGTYSTQIFILSDDKSVFYKGLVEKGSFIMHKCSEDDIVSE